jgi:hypothetical protein
MEIDLKKRRYERKEGRLIPRRKYPKPFRFVWVGGVITLIVVIMLGRAILC